MANDNDNWNYTISGTTEKGLVVSGDMIWDEIIKKNPHT